MSGTAGALAAEANTIFDILNLSFRYGSSPPSPESTHRYYICREPIPGNSITCEQVNYAHVMEFFKQKETTSTGDVMVPVEKKTPKAFDRAILSYKLWSPVVILSPK